MKSIGPVAFVGALLLTAGCSRGPQRTAASFCKKLGKDRTMLLVPMTTPEQINATLKRYRDLDELAPEEIRDQWHELTDLIVKSAASDLSTSAQRDDLERLAYTTDKSVKAVVKYSKESCGVDFSPAGEPPATTVAGG